MLLAITLTPEQLALAFPPPTPTPLALKTLLGRLKPACLGHEIRISFGATEAYACDNKSSDALRDLVLAALAGVVPTEKAIPRDPSKPRPVPIPMEEWKKSCDAGLADFKKKHGDPLAWMLDKKSGAPVKNAP